jgi:hypothetical protein
MRELLLCGVYMSSLKRTLSRKKGNKAKKLAEKEMATKVALMGDLGDKCLTCDKSFDKLNREDVATWNVVVRQEEEKVHLYCPNCWESAISLIKEYNKEKNNGA